MEIQHSLLFKEGFWLFMMSDVVMRFVKMYIKKPIGGRPLRVVQELNMVMKSSNMTLKITLSQIDIRAI